MCVNDKLMCELDNGLDDELDGKWIWRVARFRISHSYTVSELSQLIIPNSYTLRFRATLGGLGKTYDVHHALIGKRVVDFLLV